MARIVVVGAGAVGCYYGALLARAGHDVLFVLRRDYQAVRERGLSIRSPLGDFELPSARAVRHASEAGPADLVICSLKTTALGDAGDLIAPAIGPDTRILALMNGLGVEEVLAGRFGGWRVFGGMAFVCLNRGRPGVVHHLEYGRVTVGHFGHDPHALSTVAGLLAGAGIDVVGAPSLLAARWDKLCWNVPFNGLSVAAGGVGTSTITGDPGLRETAARLMREVVAVANADLANAGDQSQLDEEDIVGRMFGMTDAIGDYQPSMVIDFVLGRPLEVDGILGEPVRRARAARVPVPAMAALHALVAYIDRQRRGLAARLVEADLFHGT